MHTEDTAATQGGGPAMDGDTLAFIQGMFELVRAGNATALRPLIEKGAPTNFRNQRGDSLIMLASYHGHLETANLLLEYGADPSVPNDMGQTPMAGAAFKGNVPMVLALLDHGASVESPGPDGKTALMFAAMFNRVAIVELLVQRGARIDSVDAKGMTALDYARTMGAADAAAVLESIAKAGQAPAQAGGDA